MATVKQIAANRANARKSTGPRTPEGKAAASRNALKTGIYAPGSIIRHESAAMLQQLEAQYMAEYQPLTPTERALVDALVQMDWLLRRYRWVETETWWAAVPRLTDEQTRRGWAGHAFIAEPTIARIHRLRNSTLKQYRETVTRLRALQADRPDPLPEFEPIWYPWHDPDPDPPEPQPVETKPTSPEIGFVSPKNETPAPDPSDPADPAPADPPAARPGILLSPDIPPDPKTRPSTLSRRGAPPSPPPANRVEIP